MLAVCKGGSGKPVSLDGGVYGTIWKSLYEELLRYAEEKPESCKTLCQELTDLAKYVLLNPVGIRSFKRELTDIHYRLECAGQTELTSGHVRPAPLRLMFSDD